jgi:hypothetical protein
MPNRAAKFVSAVFAGILAGVSLTTVSHSQTVAADDCLSAPKGQTPEGSHWYYRIERGTKRHCWYLRAEGDNTLSQAAPLNISPPAKPLPPQTSAAIQNSVANAHAELSAPANVNDGPNAASPSNAAGFDGPHANAPDTRAASTVVASRWPESSGASSVSNARPATSNLAANASANSTAAQAPAVAAVTPVAADSPLQGQPGTIRTLLVEVVGAFTLAGILASIFFKLGRARNPRSGAIRVRRGPIWDSTDDDRIVPSDYPEADSLRRQPQFSRHIAEAVASDDRRAEFISRVSGRSRA